MSCGSNEFGQLGILSGSMMQDTNNIGGQRYNVPTPIEKNIIDNVEFVAAGRYHTVAIRKMNENDV